VHLLVCDNMWKKCYFLMNAAKSLMIYLWKLYTILLQYKYFYSNVNSTNFHIISSAEWLYFSPHDNMLSRVMQADCSDRHSDCGKTERRYTQSISALWTKKKKGSNRSMFHVITIAQYTRNYGRTNILYFCTMNTLCLSVRLVHVQVFH
jgi:hypothetical protein